MFAASSAVQLVSVLRDDHHGASLLSETGLALRDGHVRRAGLSLQSQLSPVLIKFPHT